MILLIILLIILFINNIINSVVNDIIINNLPKYYYCLYCFNPTHSCNSILHQFQNEPDLDLFLAFEL